MEKNEYLLRLQQALQKNNIEDVAEIMSEYEAHFSFKTADGYSEAEIIAKLDTPEALAASFEPTHMEKKKTASKIMTAIGLGFADLFFGAFLLLLFCFFLLLVGISLAAAAASICLLTGLNIYGILPSMPYWCGAVFGISLLALSVLTIAGCIYFAVFAGQLFRAYRRFHYNAYAAAAGKATRPSLGMHINLPAKTKRRLRVTTLLALSIFAASFVLAILVSMISAGAFEFWHTWQWFVS